MKGNLNRLAPAVERELREAANRASQREAKQALHESEQRYRLLWETSPDAVILMDTESRIHFANPAVKDVFGYSPEELVGQYLTLLQPERLRAGHRAGVARYLRTGVKKLNWRATETAGRRKDGTEIVIEISFSDMDMAAKNALSASFAISRNASARNASCGRTRNNSAWPGKFSNASSQSRPALSGL